MLRDGQEVRVNLAGMRVGSVRVQYRGSLNKRYRVPRCDAMISSVMRSMVNTTPSSSTGS
jgi:hypothetical protein